MKNVPVVIMVKSIFQRTPVETVVQMKNVHVGVWVNFGLKMQVCLVQSVLVLKRKHVICQVVNMLIFSMERVVAARKKDIFMIGRQESLVLLTLPFAPIIVAVLKGESLYR